MHDIKSIVADPEAFEAAMLRRGAEVNAHEIIELDRLVRVHQTQIDYFRSLQNNVAKKIGTAMQNARKFDAGRSSENISLLKEEAAEYAKQEAIHRSFHAEAKEQLQAALSVLPNLADDSVPEGGEENNTVVTAYRSEDHYLIKTKHHAEMNGIAADLGHKVGNGRLTVLRGSVARLARAIAQYMIDTHTSIHGYEEINAPVLVSADALYGTGQLPKFEDDLFKTNNGYLAPTAEVMLTNLVADEILDPMALPLRFVAHSQCFRLEAGSAGRDTRGILRQNQFEKVELVSIVSPINAEAELERMTWCAQQILEGLELPYRRVLLSAKDMGFSARKTYDLEVWMAGEGVYREISSCSWCGDFQARRMNTRIKIDKTKVIPHTLNGSALAVGRTLAAVMEYYYDDSEQAIRCPAALLDYIDDWWLPIT